MARSSYRGPGNSLVSMDQTALIEAIDEVVRSAHDGAVQVLREEVQTIADQAEAKAPVKTGRFRNSIETFTRIGDDEIRVGVGVGGSAAPHAYYVRFAESHEDAKLAGKSVWQELLRKPAMKAGDAMAAKIADRMKGG